MLRSESKLIVLNYGGLIQCQCGGFNQCQCSVNAGFLFYASPTIHAADVRNIFFESKTSFLTGQLLKLG